jgi:hypothetical protein
MNYNFNKLFDKKNDIGCFGIILIVILVFAIAFGLSCFYAWIGMLLWNWVMPIIWVGAPVMTFWPMWGLFELCGLLFRSHNTNTNSSNK